MFDSNRWWCWILSVAVAGFGLTTGMTPLVVADNQECNQLGQVQTAVIQMLSTHFEYGKGIHNLHNLVNNLQSDFSTIKDQITKLQKEELLSPKSNKQADAPLTKVGQLMVKFEKSITNITSALHVQANKYKNLQKRIHTIKRSVKKTNKIVQKFEKEQTDENFKLEDFMKKQADINSHAVARIRRLEMMVQQAMRKAELPKTECPFGFIHYGMSCYKFVNESANWINAERYCQHMHVKAHLAGIETKEENDFILMYRRYNAASWKSPWLWTGGNDLQQDGDWTWVGSGNKVELDYWIPNKPEPHYKSNDKHCVYYTAEGSQRWDNWDCRKKRINFVCEINLKH